MRFFFIPAVILLFLCCRKDNIEKHAVRKITDFYPMNKSSTWIWNVDSIYFDAFFNRIDTFHFQVRERVDTFFLDNLNQMAARIERSKRANDSAEWKFVEMSYSVVNAEYLEKVESNRRYVKISLPITHDALWDMNARNDLSQRFLYYAGVEGSYSGKYIHAATAIHIESQPIMNKLEEQMYQEVYGIHIGLLFYRKVNKQTVSGKFNGYDVKYELFTHF